MIRKRLATLAIFILLLSGCVENIPEINQNSNTIYPVLSSDQVLSIRNSINGLLSESDATLDGVMLNERLGGPELIIRRAQLVAKAAGIQDANMQIPNTSKQVIVTNSQFWPRIVFVITDITQDRQSERLLVLNQNSVHDNYKLWSVVRLFANTNLPKFDVASIGSAAVDVNDADLVMSPQDALLHYSDVLQKGNESEAASEFNVQDELQKQVTDAYQISANQLAGVGGSQSQTFTIDPTSIRALRTVNGGALAVGAINSTWVRAAGGGIYATPASDAERALFGVQQATTSITADYLTVVAIYIPPKSMDGSDDDLSVEVVGAERYPVAVRPGG